MSSGGVVCYDAPETLTLVFAIVIIVATIISYIPQVWSIVQARSSTGLSYLSLGAGLFSGLLTLINTGVLNWDKIVCCRNNPDLHYYQCLGNNILTIQIAVSPACILILYLVFLYYFETNSSHIDINNQIDEVDDTQIKSTKLREYFWALVAIMFVSCFSILAAASSYVMYYGGLADAEAIFAYAKSLGISSGVIVFFQWAPQIWTTLSMGRAGVLSMQMLLIQTPGSFLIVGFQISAKADWTTWAPYLVAGTEQAVLVGILAYYHLRNKFFPTEIEQVTEESDESSCVQFTNENGGLFNNDINSKRTSNSYQDS